MGFTWPWNKPQASRYEREAAVFASAQDAAGATTPQGPKPRGQAAPLATDIRHLGPATTGALQGIDHNLANRRAKDPAYSYFLGVYEEMLDWDAHLRACWNQYRNAYLAKPARCAPASDSAEALDICAFIEAALATLSGWRETRLGILDARYYGFTPLEVVWPDSPLPRTLRYEAPLPATPGQRATNAVRSRSAFLPVAVAPRHPRRFLFDVVTAGLGPSASGLQLLSMDNLFPGAPVEEMRFLVARHESRFGDPNGVPLARTAWVWVRMKLDTTKDEQAMLARLGNPPSVYKTPDPNARIPGTVEAASARKLASSVIGGAALVIGDTEELELLEASIGQNADAFAKKKQACNEEISKLLLIQTLTMQQGESGARAMAQTHWDVREDLLRDTAAVEAEVLQELIDWLVVLHFGPDKLELAPHWQVELDPPEDDLQRAQVFDYALNKLKKPLSAQQVGIDLKIEPPIDDADTLEFIPPPAPMLPGGDDGKDEPGRKPGDTDKPAKAQAAKRPDANETAAALAHQQGMLPLIFAPLAAASEGRREQLPTPALRRLLAESVAVMAGQDYLGALPALVRDHFAAQARETYGTGWADEPLDLRLAFALSSFQPPDELRARVVNRLNDDFTIAQLLGRAQVIGASRNTTAGASLLAAAFADDRNSPGARIKHWVRQGIAMAAAEDASLRNPEADDIFSLPRLIPERVLDVLDRRIGNALTYEEFYQLDALARGSAFTAWDLAIADVQHIGAALTDAAHTGMTSQQFADYLYDRLKAEYVQQGTALHAWHVETIYHTNLAKMYNDAQLDEIYAEREAFPYVQFLNPSPEFPACVEMAGKVWPTDSPVWRQYEPPLHFNCGSYLAALTEETLQRRGYAVESASPQASPLHYAGPADGSGVPSGRLEPFGAWAPIDERFVHLQQVRAEVASA